MNIINFTKKYDGKVIEDEETVNSKEFVQFSKDIKSTIKEICNNQDAELVKWCTGHYEVSGFIKKNENFVYFSYDLFRGLPINFNAGGHMNGILIRTAKNDKDYTGGSNNFCTIYQMGDMISRLTR